MSDNWLIFIPINPEYMPDAIAQKKARELFASFVPDADEVDVYVTDGVRFVDQGANFNTVSCPKCGTQLETAWWNMAMTKACGVDPEVEQWDFGLETELEPFFTNLVVMMPCCGSELSLNDLRYDWPAGFARFSLEALNPNVYDISDAQFEALQQVLGCELRKIWAHI